MRIRRGNGPPVLEGRSRLGDVVAKHDAGDGRDVEVVMAKRCRRLEEETHG
jgi:hypothetical protein